jgi:hypothetical protein
MTYDILVKYNEQIHNFMIHYPILYLEIPPAVKSNEGWAENHNYLHTTAAQAKRLNALPPAAKQQHLNRKATTKVETSAPINNL